MMLQKSYILKQLRKENEGNTDGDTAHLVLGYELGELGNMEHPTL